MHIRIFVGAYAFWRAQGRHAGPGAVKQLERASDLGPKVRRKGSDRFLRIRMSRTLPTALRPPARDRGPRLPPVRPHDRPRPSCAWSPIVVPCRPHCRSVSATRRTTGLRGTWSNSSPNRRHCPGRERVPDFAVMCGGSVARSNESSDCTRRVVGHLGAQACRRGLGAECRRRISALVPAVSC